MDFRRNFLDIARTSWRRWHLSQIFRLVLGEARRAEGKEDAVFQAESKFRARIAQAMPPWPHLGSEALGRGRIQCSKNRVSFEQLLKGLEQHWREDPGRQFPGFLRKILSWGEIFSGNRLLPRLAGKQKHE